MGTFGASERCSAGGLSERASASPVTSSMAPGSSFADQVTQLIPALRAFARTLAGSAAEADDLVQETLVKAIANAHRFAMGTNLKSWLFTIMRNSHHTAYRVSRRESPAAAGCASELPTALPDQDWCVRAAELRHALDRLPSDQREVLILVGALGVSYEEAADIFGCPIGTIKSRLNRARLRVLEIFDERSPQALFERSGD